MYEFLQTLGFTKCPPQMIHCSPNSDNPPGEPGETNPDPIFKDTGMEHKDWCTPICSVIPYVDGMPDFENATYVAFNPESQTYEEVTDMSGHSIGQNANKLLDMCVTECVELEICIEDETPLTNTDILDAIVAGGFVYSEDASPVAATDTLHALTVSLSHIGDEATKADGVVVADQCDAEVTYPVGGPTINLEPGGSRTYGNTNNIGRAMQDLEITGKPTSIVQVSAYVSRCPEAAEALPIKEK